MLTDEQIAALEADHGEVVRVADAHGRWEVCYARTKNWRADAKMLKAQLTNPRTQNDAQEAMARKCVVYPPLAEFDKLLDLYPLIPEGSHEAFAALLGLSAAEAGK